LIGLDQEMTWLAPHDGSPGRPAVFSDAAIPFGIAKLIAPDCEGLAKAGLCGHFIGVVGPEAESIGAAWRYEADESS